MAPPLTGRSHSGKVSHCVTPPLIGGLTFRERKSACDPAPDRTLTFREGKPVCDPAPDRTFTSREVNHYVAPPLPGRSHSGKVSMSGERKIPLTFWLPRYIVRIMLWQYPWLILLCFILFSQRTSKNNVKRGYTKHLEILAAIVLAKANVLDEIQKFFSSLLTKAPVQKSHCSTGISKPVAVFM